MQLFLDTPDVALIKDLAATGLVDGITTNPTLIAKSGRPMLQVIAEICEAIDGPVSAEVAAMDTAGMLDEGRKLADIAPNVVVKVPLTRDGLIATREFTQDGLATNVTLCFSTEILAASIRNSAHVTAAALAGADCATIPPSTFADLFKHPLTERGLDQFMADWAKTGQSIL